MQSVADMVFKATILATMVMQQLQRPKGAGNGVRMNVHDESTDQLISELTFMSAIAISASLKRRKLVKAFFVPIILKGDYSGTTSTAHERQNRAKLEGCVCVVDFHFNSSTDPTAIGGEVHYKTGSLDSEQFAESMWAEIASIGLPSHGTPVRSTAQAPRSAFIDHYSMPAILLEPLFISNPNQALWLHDGLIQSNMRRLAKAITVAIRGSFPNGGKIGLSTGHAYKSTSPNDPGSQCAAGDAEVDHTVALVAMVEEELNGV